ncbi:cytochrome P450 [Nocardia blacklockiae]|uniref:cytochrome P450 n=1 Tax=Nocardia blacklockiae TaxID=480036 RepID=UPI001894C8A8|nr:cytochrome P450 [Nocardia blacklockiae]MBF6170971.1 cytochrome P450 [Nocardia blacklockiae]
MRSDSFRAIPYAPHRFPVLGHAPVLLRRPLPFLRSLTDAGPVVRLRLGPTSAYLVTDPALVRRVLVADAARYTKGLHYRKLAALLGNSLSTTDGRHHRERRRLLQPAFHHRHLPRYADLIRESTLELADGWRAGAVIAIDDAMRELSLTVAARTLCSAAPSAHAIETIRRDLPTVLRGVAWRVLISAPVLERLPLPANRRFTAANRRLRQVVADLVAHYRSAGLDHGDLLSLLLAARDPDTGAGLTDDEIRDELVNLLFAGTETTGNAMAWLWHAVAAHPGVADRLRDEARDGSGEYAQRVARETLRLYPPPWLVSRQTRAATELGGHLLPAGAHVLFSPYALQRHPDHFPDPDVFDPDRWLPGRRAEMSRTAFLAFGAGPQNCVGEGLAMLEITTVATTLAARFRLVPVAPTAPKVSATLTPDRLRMRVTPW